MMIETPTKLQLALALSVVRLKPTDVTIYDFVHSLRDHIDACQRPQFSATYEESQNNYINAAFHFEALFKQSEKKEQDLKTELAKKDREIEKLKARLIAQANESFPRDKSSEQSSQQKRAPTAKTEDQSHPRGLLEQEEEKVRCAIEAATKESQTGDALLRHVFELLKEIQSQEVDHTYLSLLLTQTAHGARRVVQALRRGLIDKRKAVSLFSMSTEVIYRALRVSVIPMLFNGMAKLMEGSYVSSGAMGNVVYEMSCLCQALVDHLSVIASQEADASTEVVMTPPMIQCGILTLVAEVLESFVHHCNTLRGHSTTGAPSSYQYQPDPTYAALLEGLLHVFLIRAGQLIQILTIAGPLDEDMSEITAERSKELYAAKLEANALKPVLRLLLPGHAHSTFLLDDALNTVSGFTSCASSPSKMQQSPIKSSSSSIAALSQKVSLAAQPLNKLQNTLLQGMFGPDDIAGISKNILRSPLTARGLHFHDRMDDDETDDEDLDKGMSGPREEDDDGVDEFVKEMWYRVGWDVLARGFDLGPGGSQ